MTVDDWHTRQREHERRRRRKELEQIVWVVLSPGTQAYDLRRREWGVTEHESFKLITR